MIWIYLAPVSWTFLFRSPRQKIFWHIRLDSQGNKHLAPLHLLGGLLKEPNFDWISIQTLFERSEVRFCGETEFAGGTWVGIELEEPVGRSSVHASAQLRAKKARLRRRAVREERDRVQKIGLIWVFGRVQVNQ